MRLSLDGLAAALLLVGLAYWWQDNLTHELAGTAMFLLVAAHTVFNRGWYGSLGNGSYGPRRRITLAFIVGLLVAMTVLLITSVLISRDLFTFLPVESRPTARSLHILAANWALVIVSLHVGSRWTLVIGTARTVCRLGRGNALRTALLRLATLLIAGYGLWSALEMRMGAKLLLQPTLDMWDFNEAPCGFFLTYASIMSLCMAVGHYATRGAEAWRQAAARPQAR